MLRILHMTASAPHWRKKLMGLFVLACAMLGCPVVAAAGSADGAPVPATIEFNRDIRPIFSDNCYACHGPDKNKRKGDLRLDTDAMLTFASTSAPNGGPAGHVGTPATGPAIPEHQAPAPGNAAHRAITAGKPLESEIYLRLIAADPEQRMPDPASNKRLTDRQILLVKRWIEQGAHWQGHWAYLPPEQKPVPAFDRAEFVQNAIDRFVLAQLQLARLWPAPRADRRTLIRRLSLDLTGIGPTPAEVQRFVDDASPDAYEKVVDRLLASPRFGERMAVFWLDLVRFADSIGYHSDNPMNDWPYRDYVIRSFNQNKPFDQFTVEQLAGDLLPNPTLEQRVATAYNRLLQTTEEGGAQPREYEVKYLTDRVRNVSTVWMASTMGCCQCHDHKFDPFTMNDFYGMGAFFADVQEAPIGRREAGEPVPTPDQQKELDRIDRKIAAEKQTLSTPTAALADEQAAWEKKAATTDVKWKPVDLSIRAASGSKFERQADGSYRLSGEAAAKDTWTIQMHPGLSGIRGIAIETLPDDRLAARGPGAAENGNFVLSHVKLELAEPGKKAMPVSLARASADFSQDGYPVETILKTGGAGWAVMPRFGEMHQAIIEPSKPIDAGGDQALALVLQFQSPFPKHEIGRLRISVTDSADPAGALSIPPKIRSALNQPIADRTETAKTELADYFRTIAPSLNPVRERLAIYEKDKETFEGKIPRCLVTTAAEPRKVQFLHRGNWQDTTGQEMQPALPTFLASQALLEQAKRRRLTRLDLARWLVSRGNPLTARVYVNRIWRLCFGAGISKVLDDLGSQGEWPTHPELLDWLAVDFMDHGWDTKRLIKQIVMSGTYQQSSRPDDVDKERDPYNRLLAHQSRWRIDAEWVRDSALAVSGLLVEKRGGPSAKPYQPRGYWDQLNFPTRTYMADTGDGLYRRGLYTWWQRSFLHPSLAAFDAPSREEAVCERNRSNIPQQALVLLNDPTYVEAARVFATRIIREGGPTVPSRIAFAYETALSRPPREHEVQLLSDLYEKHRAQYAADETQAKSLLKVGDAPQPTDIPPAELAAWTSVARVILNLHEFITRM